MQRKTKIGKGESSSIAVAYDESNYIFATNDSRAIDVANDLLGPNQVVSCEDILEVMLKKSLLTETEFKMIREMIEG